jgi:hypothetical protein
MIFVETQLCVSFCLHIFNILKPSMVKYIGYIKTIKSVNQ